MSNICKVIFLLFFGNLVNSIIVAQESVEPLFYNTSVKPDVSLQKNESKKSAISNPVLFPFFDDFSDSIGYVKKNFWADNTVFVNTTFCKKPFSIGVATFDALDQNGKLYEKAKSLVPFKADSLTSRILNLSVYKPSDSLYLSFLYQAGGIGEKPDLKDSLVLQFWAPSQRKWKIVKSIPGLLPKDSIKPFKHVLIPLKDTAFLQNGFKFQFFNYASVNITSNEPGKNSNGDIWNIDYVYLNANRHYADTVFNDACIVNPVTSMLKNFEAMPWKHFNQPSFYGKEMAARANLLVNNSRNDFTNIEHIYTIRDVYHPTNGFDPFGNSLDLYPNQVYQFETDFTGYTPDVNDSDNDSAVYEVTVKLKVGYVQRGVNDVSVYYQKFLNYYAYDDGSAEYGYGLRGEGIINARVALKYNAYKEDTLQAIDIYFNRALNNENIQDFKLCVWGEKKGVPDSLYASVVKVEFNNGKPYRYMLKKPLFVPTTFYIGWQQMGNQFMNVGMDYNRTLPKVADILVNFQGTDDGWEKSQFRNALMMRPVMGSYKNAQTNIRASETTAVSFLRVYPNPAKDILNLELPQQAFSSILVRVFDLSGKMVLQQKLSDNTLNISRLNEGVYILQLNLPNQTRLHSKFVKALK